jgi:hypothetical protein
LATQTVPGSKTDTVGELSSYLRLYARSLRAANRAESTVYKDAAERVLAPPTS